MSNQPQEHGSLYRVDLLICFFASVLAGAFLCARLIRPAPDDEATSLIFKNHDASEQIGIPSTPTLSEAPEKPEVKQPANKVQSFEAQYKNDSTELQNKHIINSRILDEQRREQARMAAEENTEQVQNKNKYLNATDGALKTAEQSIRRGVGFQPKK